MMWIHHTILRTASLLAPHDQRAEWLEGWRSELWYIPRRGATLFCLGAFRDALWLTRHNLTPMKRPRLESPLLCLAFLAALAAASAWITLHLPGPPKPGLWPSHFKLRDLLEGSLAMLSLSCVFLPATWLAMGRTPADSRPLPRTDELRRALFLALKVALLQPMMFCTFMLLIRIGPLFTLAPQIGCIAAWFLAFRWVLIDQRQRCPVCLRSLTTPVLLGNSSRTFLAWYGVESICSRGHGLQQIPEISSSYSGQPQWLTLDDSWNTEAAGMRQL